MPYCDSTIYRYTAHPQCTGGELTQPVLGVQLIVHAHHVCALVFLLHKVQAVHNCRILLAMLKGVGWGAQSVKKTRH